MSTRSEAHTEHLHTPGPWRLAKQPPNIGLTVTLYGFGPKTLGVIHTGSDEYIANARLISAAPDMLAALKALCEADRDELNDSTSDVWNQAVDVIRKAEGGSST